MAVEEQKVAAVLTLKGAGKWSEEGRWRIAQWLRNQAKSLMRDGDNYAPRFRARYFTKDEE